MKTPNRLPARNRASYLFAGLAACSLFGAESAQSALLAYEGFNYAPSTTSGTTGGVVGESGGFGFSGGWVTHGTPQQPISITSPGMTYSGLPTSGNKVDVASTDANGHSGIIRNLSTTYTYDATAGANNTYYISFLAQSDASIAGGYFRLSLFNGGTTGGEAFKLGAGDGTTSTTWAIDNYSTKSTVATTTLSLLVYKVVFTSATASNWSLFINPDLSTEAEPLVADLAFIRNSALSFDAIRFQGNRPGTFDEFRLATTWADAIPEPSSALLGVLGSSLLLIRKRRIG